MLSLSAARMNSASAALVSASRRKAFFIKGIMRRGSSRHVGRRRVCGSCAGRQAKARGDARDAAPQRMIVERAPLRPLAHAAPPLWIPPELGELGGQFLRGAIGLDLAAELVHVRDALGPLGEVARAQHWRFDIA